MISNKTALWNGKASAIAVVAFISAGGLLVAQGVYQYWGVQAIPETRLLSLDLGKPLFQLEVPRLSQARYVVEGSDEEALRKGPGHVKGSVMPGETGNCVIAGHRDLHFRFLKELRRGDSIFLATAEGRFRYRVVKTEIVAPTNLRALKPTQDAELHLITCYPFYFIGRAPKRFVVTATLD